MPSAARLHSPAHAYSCTRTLALCVSIPATSAVFRRVAPGAGLWRYIGPAALQVCLDALDYIFCAVRPLYADTHGS
jgi:hypothetical protein